jgi:hypothetical protein
LAPRPDKKSATAAGRLVRRASVALIIEAFAGVRNVRRIVHSRLVVIVLEQRELDDGDRILVPKASIVTVSY